ncbi:type VI secretion system baseplate subunit TssE [Robbsia sp. KACC 23696]|uniref:type VI secretion system baseplate subunit TssE n=1 Tax=Robbsia sp. KACC 23696 TaxID=3149231 RepID=UPI00325AFDE7
MSIGPVRFGHRLPQSRRLGVDPIGDAPSLLFDRLASHGEDGSCAAPARHRTEKGSYADLASAWRASIANELSDLFQTLSRVPIRRYEVQILDLLDYGLPDLRGLSMQSAADRQLLARVMVLAITRFEPRLSDVHITLHADSVGPVDAQLSIRARIRAGPVREEAHFVLTQSARGLSRVVPLDPASEDDAAWQGPIQGSAVATD